MTASLESQISDAVARVQGGHFRAKGAPGVSVALVEDNRLVLSRSNGFADLDTSTPVHNDTRFRVASLSKMLVSVSILQLASHHRLKLSDRLIRYIPDAPFAKYVTLNELLSNTSGIPDFLGQAITRGIAAKRTSIQDLLAIVAARPLQFQPGSRYAYSNTNYVLLGKVLEAVTKQTLADYETLHILKVAKMTHSSFSDATMRAQIATGYDTLAGGIAPSIDPSWKYAAGDLISTADDIALFDIALMKGKLLDTRYLDLIEHSGNTMNDRSKYSLGFIVAHFGSLDVLGNHGGIPGFASEDEMILRKGFAIVVMGNATDFSTQQMNGAVLSLLCPVNFFIAHFRS